MTKPRHGGEGGVGWEFALAMAEKLAMVGRPLTLVIDAADEAVVRSELQLIGLTHTVQLRPVQSNATNSLDGRTRARYIRWTRHAKALIEAERLPMAECAAQVTFATATLPPVVTSAQSFVWGPVALPPVLTSHAAYKMILRTAVRNYAQRNSRTRFLAQNDHTYKFLREQVNADCVLEPNVVAEPRNFSKPEEGRLAICGTLNARKRPWLAIEALAKPRLREHELAVIGDGPLRSKLNQMAQDLGVSRRVHFLGHLPRDEAVNEIARASVLIHPSIREGAGWVVGEAAACGRPTVYIGGSGVDAVARLSDNGSLSINATENLAEALAEGALHLSTFVGVPPTKRWTRGRIASLYENEL